MCKSIDTKVLARDGFILASGVLGQANTCDLANQLSSITSPESTARSASGNARRLLERCPAVRRLADCRAVRNLVEPVLGGDAFAVRGLLFDKIAGANWQVGWHQDLMIPVTRRVETDGFSAWSNKQGVTHVRPPAEVLASMLTLRVHIDDCQADNGPLEVLPGTHRLGIIDEGEVGKVAATRQAVLCSAAAGDVLVMRPLILHASRMSQTVNRRRVVHLEFAAEPLPGQLEWYQPRLES